MGICSKCGVIFYTCPENPKTSDAHICDVADVPLKGEVRKPSTIKVVI